MAAWNYIYFDHNTEAHWCAVCDCYMSSEISSNEHVDGARHGRAVKRYGSSIIIHGKNKYYCELCDCWIQSTTNILQHLKGQRHQDAFDASDSEDSEDSEDEDSLDPYEFIIDEGNDYKYCYFCNVRVIGEALFHFHARSHQHREAVEKYGHDVIESKYSWYECDLCECKISGYQNIYQHVTGRKHTDLLEESDSDSD